MQLNNKNITRLISLASCNLLLSPTIQAESEWDVDTAILFYTETDRVSAVEPVTSMSKDLGDDEILSFKLVIDALTGASANGSVPSSQVQTLTTSSGTGTFTTKANETPLDDTFRDTRVAFSMNWEKPIDSNNRRTLGFNVSREFDFTSLAGNVGWQHDINQKNTSFTVAANFELDEIAPVGDKPIELSTLGPPHEGDSTDTRNQVDLIFGVTQIINRSSLFQVNYSYSKTDGYLTDPYKVVSVVDTAPGANLGEPLFQLHEKRPDSRDRQSVFTRYKKMFDSGNMFDISYRFMTDDWGIESHTIDTHYRWQLNGGYYIQPHLRLYQQGAADFYRYFLLDSEVVPSNVSADYRLGDLDTQTVGIKYGRSDDKTNDWSVRLEYYLQSGESSPDEAIGQLRKQNLFPDVEAWILQFNYSFKW